MNSAQQKCPVEEVCLWQINVMSCTSAVPADSGFIADGDVIVAHLMSHLLNEASLNNQIPFSEL